MQHHRLVTPQDGECIHRSHALGRHIHHHQQTNNDKCSAVMRSDVIIGQHMSPSKVPLPAGDLDPHLIYGSLGSHETKLHLDQVSHFCKLTSVPNKQTDRQTPCHV